MRQDWQNYIKSQINIVFFLSFPIKKRVWSNLLSYLWSCCCLSFEVFSPLFVQYCVKKAPSRWEWNMHKKKSKFRKTCIYLFASQGVPYYHVYITRTLCGMMCGMSILGHRPEGRRIERRGNQPTVRLTYLFSFFSRLFGFKNAQSTGRSVFCGKIPTYVWPARDSAWGKWFLFNAWLQRRGLPIPQWTCTHQWILHTQKSRSGKLYKPCSLQWICQTWTTCETQSAWRAESEAGVWIQQFFPRGFLVWFHVGLRIFLHHLLPVYVLEHRWVFSAKNCVHVGPHNVHRSVCKGCNSVAQTTLSSSHFSGEAIWGWIRNAINTRHGWHADPRVLGVLHLRSLPGSWTVYLCILFYLFYSQFVFMSAKFNCYFLTLWISLQHLG